MKAFVIYGFKNGRVRSKGGSSKQYNNTNYSNTLYIIINVQLICVTIDIGTARILEAASILMFLLMLIVMAKGYTITRGRLSTTGSIKIAVFMTVYTVVYAVLFIYEAQVYNQASITYVIIGLHA